MRRSLSPMSCTSAFGVPVGTTAGDARRVRFCHRRSVAAFGSAARVGSPGMRSSTDWGPTDHPIFVR